MQYCTTCKKAFADDVTECPEDHVALVDELPYQTVDAPNTTWVEITSVGTADEARILQGFLEAEGVPCQIENVQFSMEPITFGTMGDIRIYVSAGSEQTALDLLKDRDDNYGELPGEESVMTDEGPAEIDDDSESVGEEES
jgi:Putative prokaryotic signal transducing protein